MTEIHKYKGKVLTEKIMAFSKEKKMIQKYNRLFEKNNLKLRVIIWNSDMIELNSIILKSERDRRNFRVRCASPNLLPYIDKLYFNKNSSKDIDNIVKNIQKENASKCNKLYWKKLPENEKESKRQHMRQVQKLVDYTKIKYRTVWNKGKTKETDIRLMTLSQQRTGKGNPRFGCKMSEEEKQKKSKLLKHRIKTGKWTPHIHNSRTHWQCIYNNKKYRSSWEAMYASLNPLDEYEQVRMYYPFGGKTKVYIVDFVNHQEKTLTEVKPVEHINTKKFKAKTKAAIQWCLKNDYQFRILTQQYFIENFNKIEFNKITIPNLRQKLAKIKYETNKTNYN